MPEKNRLTCTNDYSTSVRWKVGENVDATAKKLVDRLNKLEDERFRISHEIRGIRTALQVAGISPTKYNAMPDEHESEYYLRHSFATTTLGEACQRILEDYKDSWLSKSQIEYLIARGGYQFSAKDTKNSVAVTLQRLADGGKCDVERVRGSQGNRYRWISRFPRKADDKPQS